MKSPFRANTFYGPLALRIPQPEVPQPVPTITIDSLTHPDYDENLYNWDEWRLTYEGGRAFVDRYLERFSRRESPTDFRIRKSLTPIPAFAAAAIDDVKNSIFERATDIARVGGPQSYIDACTGLKGGVDRKGATMNFFIGDSVIAELLTMKKVGVFVDMPLIVGQTQADRANIHPYIYTYKAEDIRTWSPADSGDGKDFNAVLLRTYQHKIDSTTKLPSGYITLYRHLYFGQDGFVLEDLYTKGGKKVGATRDSKLTKIPFVVFEINQSLLKNISRHQIALLNLGSSDVNWVMKAGFPLYTEQVDARSFNSHLTKKPINDPDIHFTEECLTNTDENYEETDIGASHGRKYAKGLDRPGFINPSAEPLKASMDKQGNLRDEIRLLINLNLSNVQPKMASAESKGFDLQGLEAGLSYIGLELQNGERKIGEHWSMYESAKEQPTINYPKRYNLKSEKDQQDEVDHLIEVRKSIVSMQARREITKKIAALTIGNSVSSRILDKIYLEIDKAKIIPDDSGTMIEDIKQSLLSLETAAEAKGYPKSELKKAAIDAKKRLARIQAAQTSKNNKLPVNPAARGLGNQVDPIPNSGSLEKVGKNKRGKGK